MDDWHVEFSFPLPKGVSGSRTVFEAHIDEVLEAAIGLENISDLDVLIDYARNRIMFSMSIAGGVRQVDVSGTAISGVRTAIHAAKAAASSA